MIGQSMRWPVAAAMVAAVVAFAAVVVPPGIARADTSHRLTIGQALTIPLQGNPSTGYAWTLDTKASRGLDLVRVTEEGRAPEPPREPGKPPMPGQSSTFLWRVVGLQPGEAVLVFSYARSWENVPPVRQERVVITISGR